MVEPRKGNQSQMRMQRFYDKAVEGLDIIKETYPLTDEHRTFAGRIRFALDQFMTMANNKFSHWYQMQQDGRAREEDMVFKTETEEEVLKSQQQVEYQVDKLLSEGRLDEAKKLVATTSEARMLKAQLRSSAKLLDIEKMDARSFSALAPALLRSGGTLQDKDPPKDAREEPPRLAILMPNVCDCGGVFKCEACGNDQIGTLEMGMIGKEADGG